MAAPANVISNEGYRVEPTGYLPEPGPQGLPHLPKQGEEATEPTGANSGPGVALYAAQ